MAEKLAENCGRQGDPCSSTFQDGGAGTKAKRKKNKKKRGRKTAQSIVEKEHENKDDSPGSDEEYMDCSESASPESTKGEQKKAKLLETKEPKPKDDEKGKQNDPERTVESCPVEKVEKIKQEEPMDYEDASSHALDPPSKDAQSPPDSKDLRKQRDEKFTDHTHKSPKDGNATQQPLGPQKDQHFAGGADTAARAGKRKKHKKKSRWDQTSPDSKVANVKEEQGQVNPTSSTQDACMDASNRHAKLPVEVPKDEGRDPHQRDQHSKQLHKRGHVQHEPIGRGKERTDYHDSRGGQHHDRRSDRQYGEFSRGRGDSGRRDRQNHPNQDYRSSGAYHHPQRGNWRSDGREDSQKGPRGPRQEREYGRHGTDGNWHEGNQRPRRRSEERPKYTVGVAPDGKEQFAFFFRGSSPFSQWHFCNFTVDGVKYVCAEQFMMHQKAILFGDKKTAHQILQSNDPREQKQLGREVKNFDEEVWSKHCQDIVTEGNLAKFRQNYGLRKVLLETDGMTLVEASPYDEIWGIGLDAEDPQAVDRDQWRGWNLLGEILTNVREQIIREEREGKTMSRGGIRDKEEKSVEDIEPAEGREERGKESTTSRPVKLDRNFPRRQGGPSQVTTDRTSGATDEDDSGEKFHFFSEKKDPFFRSQHPCQFEIEGNVFSSAEQYMWYHKAIFCGSEDAARQILMEEDVSKQKKLSKKAKENADEWNKSQLQTAVFDGNLAKFNQNPDLCKLLLGTDGKALALTTDQGSDNFWGIGLSADDPKARKRDQWKGENVLGDILTRVRDKILQDRGGERSGQTDASTAATKEPTS